jgi:hypothetical protein
MCAEIDRTVGHKGEGCTCVQSTYTKVKDTCFTLAEYPDSCTEWQLIKIITHCGIFLITSNHMVRTRQGSWGENSRIFRDAADQTLPVSEYSEIDNWIQFFSYIFRKYQLQVTFGLLHLGKSGSFRHSVCGQPINKILSSLSPCSWSYPCWR